MRIKDGNGTAPRPTSLSRLPPSPLFPSTCSPHFWPRMYCILQISPLFTNRGGIWAEDCDASDAAVTKPSSNVAAAATIARRPTIAESVVDERASIIRRAAPSLCSSSFLSDLDQEDENMSKPKGTDADEQTDDEDGLEDAHTHTHTCTWAWFGVDLKECRN